MKYKAKQMSTGDWAVFTGKRFFPSTVTKDKAEAEKEACIMSATWHRDQMDKCQQEYSKLVGTNKAYGPHWSDLMA